MKLTARHQEARIAILRDVESHFGGTATWSQLHSRGHHYMQVSAAALRGDLRSVRVYHYEITSAGRQALATREGGGEVMAGALHRITPGYFVTILAPFESHDSVRQR